MIALKVQPKGRMVCSQKATNWVEPKLLCSYYRSKQKSEISSERGDLEGEIMEGLPNKPDGVICTVFFLCLGIQAKPGCLQLELLRRVAAWPIRPCVLESSHATNSIFSTTRAGHPVSQNFVSNQTSSLVCLPATPQFFTSSRVFLLLSLPSIRDVSSFDHLSQIGLDCRG